MRQYSNTAVEAELTNSASNVDATIVVDDTTGFPVTFPYTLSIDADNASKELVEVTAAAGTTLTVTRGVDGTSAVSHSIGAAVRHDHSARDFREAQEHIAATSDVHGVSGDLVGATQAQVITNKDLTSGTNTFPSSLATDAEVAAVQADIDDHIADATDAHDASAISFSPTGTIASTNAQAAIAEVASEAASALSAALPAGVITQYGGSSAPSGWLLCDGSSVATASYPALFSAIGYTYGGSGANFTLPNLKGKVPVGRDATQTEFDTLGETGGAKTHTLTTAEIPAHVHDIDHNHPNFVSGLNGEHSHLYNVRYRNDISNTAGSKEAITGVGGANHGDLDGSDTGITDTQAAHGHNIDIPALGATDSGTTGDGGAHNNLQPYIVLNHIIKT